MDGSCPANKQAGKMPTAAGLAALHCVDTSNPNEGFTSSLPIVLSACILSCLPIHLPTYYTFVVWLALAWLCQVGELPFISEMRGAAAA